MPLLTEQERDHVEQCLQLEKDPHTHAKEFGSTDYCPSAGWILSDGTMIDLGYGRSERVRDHREIQHCFPDHIHREDLIDVAQHEMGMVRMSMAMQKNHRQVNNLLIDLSTQQKVTPTQWNVLKRCAKEYDAEITYDIYHHGSRRHQPELPEFDGMNASRVIEMVKRIHTMFQNGYTSQEIVDSFE